MSIDCMIEFYQHIPDFIGPIAFSIGSFAVHWYSLMWIAAFAIVYFLLIWRIKRGERKYDKNFIQDVISNSLIGALIGGRLGYVIFYDLPYYIAHPLQIISPYDFTSGQWVGIYGMSYHGGIIGVAIAIIWTAHKKDKNFLDLFDFIAPVAPLGYMFGRLGNFFNAELVGRVTTSPIGMYFNGENITKHPSQLYEAFFEGLVLFVILWSLRNKNLSRGMMTSFYIIGYSITRFGVEYFRAPDAHLGFIFAQITMGQILSFIMFGVGFGLFIWSYRQRNSSIVDK
jgi:phosphatidylglycerol:prolipoprotein diacylglycerol transferase